MSLKINYVSLLASGFLILSLILCSYYFSHTAGKPDKLCLASVTNHSESETTSADYKLVHKLKILDKGSGYDNFRGELTSGEKTYYISRTVNFIFTKSSAPGLYRYRIVSTHTFSSDNIPDDILNRHITFLREDVERNVSLESLGDSNILISDTSGPSFTCSLR